MDGRETLAEILKHYQDTKVIILSFEKDMIFAVDFILAGAHAYLIKDADSKTFIDTIIAVHQKGEYLSLHQAKVLASVVRHATNDSTHTALPPTSSL